MEPIITCPPQTQSEVKAEVLSELCLKKKSKSEHYFNNTWLEVPPLTESLGRPSICWIDMWGEKTCSDDYDFQRLRDGYSAPCKQVYNEDKTLFDDIRSGAERLGFTFSETKKALQWVFNCTGRLPLKTCATETDDALVNQGSF